MERPWPARPERQVMNVALHRKQRVQDEFDLYPPDDGAIVDHGYHGFNRQILVDSMMFWFERHGVRAWVTADNAIYYQLGEPRKVVGPDFYVVLGAREWPKRDCWRLWNEGFLTPQVIVEFISPKTARKDRVTNFAIYRDTLKVPDYYVCDNVRRMRVDGFHLQGGEYVPLLPGPDGRLRCESLDMSVGFHGRWLRFFDADGSLVRTGRELYHETQRQLKESSRQAEESSRRADEASRCADEEARRRTEAEAELDRLRRLLDEREG